MNISEVARRAGVSRSTVSYALSGKRPIGESTRQRILAVIDEVNYQPNAIAKALADGSTRAIGLIVPPRHRHFDVVQLQFVGAVAEAASERGFDTLLSPSGEQRERAFKRLVGERRVDGLVLMETVFDDPAVLDLIESGFPFVTIGRIGHDQQHGWVDLDYAGLVRTAVAELAGLGHRHIGLVNRPQELLSGGYGPAIQADRAFATAVADHHVYGTTVSSEDSDDDGDRCMGELLKHDPRLTAVVSINERSLGGFVSAARARGIVPGDDLSVIAIAPDHLAAALDPPITAAHVPAEEMGRAAVTALLDHLHKPTAPFAHILMTPAFTERGSARPPVKTPRRSHR
jgi:DNA-binding LacI/PurR family transcriptional regulator